MTVRAAKILICVLIIMVSFSVVLHGKEDFSKPKEFGVYIKTGSGLKRLMPNIVFEERGLLYIEMNNPPRFLLKDVEFFVLYGKHDMGVLTINPLLFFQPSELGKLRYIFGKEIGFDVKKQGEDLYVVKPKGLLGRGYMTLWINETAWDFVID
ncbi:MAG: hypothetical protein GXY80_04135 [Syntrophorhabdus aromaticivorans]|uniref:Uncharacterized protein n=2 Tax=Syntrophorhabdus aromaticivorans TaxID=328301 RepID=A0A971M3L3_9BACT|nr:hypothetical protein [Syntrophorhabdus aromaticivorans]